MAKVELEDTLNFKFFTGLHVVSLRGYEEADFGGTLIFRLGDKIRNRNRGARR